MEAVVQAFPVIDTTGSQVMQSKRSGKSYCPTEFG